MSDDRFFVRIFEGPQDALTWLNTVSATDEPSAHVAARALARQYSAAVAYCVRQDAAGLDIITEIGAYQRLSWFTSACSPA